MADLAMKMNVPVIVDITVCPAKLVAYSLTAVIYLVQQMVFIK